MSYILDALKRADAERERGQVPGLHSQPVLTSPAAAMPTRPSPTANDTRRMGMAAAGVLAVVAVAGWWWLTGGPAVPVSPASPSAQAAPDAPLRSPVPEPAAPPAPAATQAPALPAPARPFAPEAAATAATPILAPAPSAPEPAASRRAETRNAIPKTSADPAAPASAAEPTAGTAPPRRYADLSGEQRAQLPPLSVSGASYSANPAHRLLIVNGAVMQEGQEVAPGLTLERIGLREAVLNHQGLRFSIGY